MINRMDKINKLIKQEISIQLLDLFPDEIISITQVSVSADISYAKIWVTSLTDPKDAVKKCQKEAPRISHAISQKIEMKRMPRLHFVEDTTGFSADRIDHLIDQLKDEDK